MPSSCLWVNDFSCSIANSDNFLLVQKSMLDFISAAKFVPWENLAEYEDDATAAEDTKKHLLTAIENAISIEEICNTVNDSNYFTLI